MDEDLSRLNRVVSSIVQAVEEDVLTADEADAVIGFIAESFVHRRIEEVLTRVTQPKAGGWFALRGSTSYTGDNQ